MELDPLTLRGEAAAADLGALPGDSLAWTYGGVPVGTGTTVETRAIAGRQRIVLTARYGTRTAADTMEIEAAGDGLGRLLWTVPLATNLGDALTMHPASGTLYAHDGDGIAVAMSLDGTVRWSTDLGIRAQRSSPAVGTDGSLYYGFVVGYGNGFPSAGKPGGVLAVNPDGSQRWVFVAADHGPAGSTYYHVHGGVALDNSDRVYVATEEADRPLYSLNPDGTVRWRGPTGGGPSASYFWSYTTLVADSLAMAVRSNDSLPVTGAADGARRWAAGPVKPWSCLLTAAVGTNGTVYVRTYTGDPYDPNDPAVSAYAPDGTERWTRRLPVAHLFGSPVVGQNRIYFATPRGGVLVLSTAGDSVAWWGPRPEGFFHDGITLAANGVVYVTANDTLLSYSPGGTRRFAVAIPHRVSTTCWDSQGGPVIGPDGTVYVRASDAGVMAFRDTVGPATDAPWPTLQGSFMRRGQRAIDRGSRLPPP